MRTSVLLPTGCLSETWLRPLPRLLDGSGALYRVICRLHHATQRCRARSHHPEMKAMTSRAWAARPIAVSHITRVLGVSKVCSSTRGTSSYRPEIAELDCASPGCCVRVLAASGRMWMWWPRVGRRAPGRTPAPDAAPLYSLIVRCACTGLSQQP